MVDVPANPPAPTGNTPYFGWREWAALPQLRIKRLRVKIDTGARTSALHAFEVLPFERNGQPWVRFGLHLSRKEGELAHWCEAPMLDRRIVTDSGGHTEDRYVIASTIVFGSIHWPLAITLTNRDTMRYRMLVGRSGLPVEAQVRPHHSWLQGQPVYDKQAFRSGPPTLKDH